MLVEEPRKKALASSVERSGLLITKDTESIEVLEEKADCPFTGGRARDADERGFGAS